MGGNVVCPCYLFMEYKVMGRTNVGKGYTQMILREKRDVKVMAKEVCTDALRIPSLCRCPQCGGNDRKSLRCV